MTLMLFDLTYIVTLEFKALYKLLAKKDDENFELGGRGYDVELWLFCQAKRVIKSIVYTVNMFLVYNYNQFSLNYINHYINVIIFTLYRL